ncbi:cilia- and flagella-associated protein 337 [Centroberyx affinis]|uniref:cilia- and flagella-associated protein 337 n=1 Tax=Centroberyx affinis TaxID=166261 RepID=UPI003A5B93E2
MDLEERSQCPDIDPACGVSPAEKLSLEHLQLLRDAFTCHTPSDRASRPRAAGLQTGENRQNGWSGRNRGASGEHAMNFEEFQEALSSVIGPDIEATWVERFFSEVDIDCVGRVDWQRLCSYLFLEFTERNRASNPRAALLDTELQIRHCSHNKREPTVRVVAVPHPPPLRYISVSKGGQLTVWNSGLHILKTLGLAGDPAEVWANKRRFRGWTTDAVYMGNVHKVAIATDCRDIHFVNVSTASIFEDVHLFGFRNVPTALCYWHDVQSPEQPSLLLWGDDRGGVHLMRFLNPSKGLFENPFRKDKGPQRIYFADLGEHSLLVSYRHIPNIHQEPINRVMLEPHTDLIMTSSESNTTSVVIMDVSLKQEPYIWKIEQGARCFDYCRPLQVVVTGGFDRTVRLWTRFVTSRPVATLPGHRTTVLDVAIYQPFGQIFSYSKDAELRVWDISTHQCLRSVHLQFPCLQPGRIPEHGSFPLLLLSPLLPGQTQPHLLVGCKDHLALLNLAESKVKNESGAALSCALYNPTLRQVVTGHADSSLSLWDVETGRRRLTVSNAHGEEELTCMALDSSHRRLITGARNGTVKVWSLLSGLNLHKLEPVTRSEVTGVVCLHGNQLLAMGWSRRIAQYDITGAKDVYVRADMSWKSGGVHSSDILAVCQCPALGVVATASHDGEVIIWRLETQGPLLRLQRDTQPGAAPPVDSLLFLQHRAANRQLRNRAVLVSSQAGGLCFWSITGHTHTYGQFYAPDQPGERVLDLSSDQSNNSILVSGDTTGRLQIWDISDYALDSTQEPVCERPPLLRCWKAHKGALVSVEVLDFADRLFLLTASADGSAGLWTENGDRVGSFGQDERWSITDPATYQREKQSDLTEDTEEEEEEEEERTDADRSGPSGVKGHTSNPAYRGQTSQEKCHSEASAPPQSQTESTSTLESDHEPKQPTSLCEDFCSKVALCHERRRLCGDVNLNKLFLADGVCTPHQALVLQVCEHPVAAGIITPVSKQDYKRHDRCRRNVTARFHILGTRPALWLQPSTAGPKVVQKSVMDGNG